MVTVRLGRKPVESGSRHRAGSGQDGALCERRKLAPAGDGWRVTSLMTFVSTTRRSRPWRFAVEDVLGSKLMGAARSDRCCSELSRWSGSGGTSLCEYLADGGNAIAVQGPPHPADTVDFSVAYGSANTAKATSGTASIVVEAPTRSVPIPARRLAGQNSSPHGTPCPARRRTVGGVALGRGRRRTRTSGQPDHRSAPRASSDSSEQLDGKCGHDAGIGEDLDFGDGVAHHLEGEYGAGPSAGSPHCPRHAVD